LGLMSESVTMAKNGKVTTEEIKAALQQHINVPILEVDQSQKDLLLNLEQVIHQQMIDQEPAVKAVSDTLRRASTSLREQNRPIGSFLFVGPTGVGKTELAKTLAATYFKNSAAFLPFDMSNYQTTDSAQRLIGNENMPGELTEAIKRKPYALVLLDEFEKASPQILTLFLQVLEEGRLTDFAGKTVDFTNTIIIATSNAGSLTIAQGLAAGKTVEQLDQPVKDELLKVYRPELVNRFDEVVIFKPLSQEELEKVVVLKLAGLQKQLKEQGYDVQFGMDIVKELAQKGFDPVLGARPMRRLVQDTIEANLSKYILENKLIKGQNFSCTTDVCMYPQPKAQTQQKSA
jgi:ATP-dependent Clp protease ATP-binding subunit ClpB